MPLGPSASASRDAQCLLICAPTEGRKAVGLILASAACHFMESNYSYCVTFHVLTLCLSDGESGCLVETRAAADAGLTHEEVSGLCTLAGARWTDEEPEIN